jgi:hypothetical protein
MLIQINILISVPREDENEDDMDTIYNNEGDKNEVSNEIIDEKINEKNNINKNENKKIGNFENFNFDYDVTHNSILIKWINGFQNGSSISEYEVFCVVIRDYNLNDIYQVNKSVNEVLTNKIEVRTDKILDESTNKTGDEVLTNKIDDDTSSNNNVDISTKDDLLSDIDDNNNNDNNKNDDNKNDTDNNDNHNNAEDTNLDSQEKFTTVDNSNDVNGEISARGNSKKGHGGDNNDLLEHSKNDSITINNNDNNNNNRYINICSYA